MKRLFPCILASLLLVFHADICNAQLNVFIDKAIKTFGRITGFIGYDTTYIAPPARPWLVAPFAQSTGFDVYNSNTLSGIGYQSFRSSRTRYFTGVNASYKGFGFEVGFNPQKVFQNKKFNEKVFNLNYYSNRFCIDAMFNYSPSIAGTLRMNGEWNPLPKKHIGTEELTSFKLLYFQQQAVLLSCGFQSGIYPKKECRKPPCDNAILKKPVQYQRLGTTG